MYEVEYDVASKHSFLTWFYSKLKRKIKHKNKLHRLLYKGKLTVPKLTKVIPH